ncbi:multidrug efflux MFS transporter Mdt(A) [Lactococcus formosensis]|jgi:DHA3 family macrolide efflux protein-like MFS transporter|uniref:Multidrug efflux pump Tap n=1 Tax=Lactococcus formosensis TaxID=1281486 RepID=A0A9Q8Y3Y1_9LACT|nr:multidrug efflux MFS transporter Mdt(A) [Lactococcus formosensis]NHI73142.1 multidrug efflux MFS transporter Mdt(A) [Lactococcus garvieae]MCH1723689.1 multidrug efflux MFS transporter Mdt(A) [Lactococcus formosensis]MDT2726542.1 multidrug efflux MFS transporter Mdt(A) [Lactococcus formosensis]NHI99152.1 multidrug efflux MFS transporter Mdt(A) [Lactococcus garvieae]NHJ18535.1 multidrug efflux MFS transporter Mdt(A) [Lactococcus garvieae]
MNTKVPTNWRKNFYLFLIGQLLTGVTSMIVQYAIIWYLTLETGEESVLAIATLVGMLPMAILSPFVGPFIDRINKKFLLIFYDAVVAVIALGLFIYGINNDVYPLWMVFVTIGIRAVAQTAQMPTVQSIMPTMVPEEEITRVNGQFGIIQSLIFIVSPGIGAFMVATLPIHWVILLDVIGFILGAGMLLLVKIPEVASQGEKISVIKDALEGFNILRENKPMWKMTLIGALFMLLFMPAMSLYPLVTTKYFGGTIVHAGWVEVLFAAAMLIGSFAVGIFGKTKNRMPWIIAAYLIVGLSIGGSGFLPGNMNGFWIFLVLNVFAGIVGQIYTTMNMAITQQSFEAQYLGRVMGIVSALMSIAGPVGLIFAAPVAESIGVQNMLVIAGFGGILSAFLLYVTPSVRNYDKFLQRKLENEGQ